MVSYALAIVPLDMMLSACTKPGVGLSAALRFCVL